MHHHRQHEQPARTRGFSGSPPAGGSHKIIEEYEYACRSSRNTYLAALISSLDAHDVLILVVQWTSNLEIIFETCMGSKMWCLTSFSALWSISLSFTHDLPTLLNPTKHSSTPSRHEPFSGHGMQSAARKNNTALWASVGKNPSWHHAHVLHSKWHGPIAMPKLPNAKHQETLKPCEMPKLLAAPRQSFRYSPGVNSNLREIPRLRRNYGGRAILNFNTPICDQNSSQFRDQNSLTIWSNLRREVTEHYKDLSKTSFRMLTPNPPFLP